MDKLKSYVRNIDIIDAKIINLFEQRMSLTKKAAEYKAKAGIKRDKKINSLQIVDKVTSNACDTQVIEYTEGLVMYLYNASRQYSRCLIKRQKLKASRH